MCKLFLTADESAKLNIAAPWQIAEAALLFLLGISLSALPGFLIKEPQTILGIELLSYALQISVFIIGPYLLVRRKYGLSLASLGITRPSWQMIVGIGCCGGLALYLLNLVLTTLLTAILPAAWIKEQSVVLLLQMAASPGEYAAVIVIILVLAPLGEELLFRAFLYPALRKYLRAGKTILLCGLIFAAVHLNLLAFLPLCAAGIGFSYMYEKHHNLFCNVTAHMLWNGLSLLLYFIQ